jgi:ATP-dependent DNA ligase
MKDTTMATLTPNEIASKIKMLAGWQYNDNAISKRFQSRRLAQNGLTAYGNATRKGLEGMVAKDRDAPYEERRSSKWLKVKVHLEEEFVIGGFTAPAGARKHLGALLLGAYRGEDLIFVGKSRYRFHSTDTRRAFEGISTPHSQQHIFRGTPSI